MDGLMEGEPLPVLHNKYKGAFQRGFRDEKWPRVLTHMGFMNVRPDRMDV